MYFHILRTFLFFFFYFLKATVGQTTTKQPAASQCFCEAQPWHFIRGIYINWKNYKQQRKKNMLNSSFWCPYTQVICVYFITTFFFIIGLLHFKSCRVIVHCLVCLPLWKGDGSCPGPWAWGPLTDSWLLWSTAVTCRCIEMKKQNIMGKKSEFTHSFNFKNFHLV